MASFTGITAERADEILGMSVSSASINFAGHLILTRGNGTTIDAGDFTTIVSDILETQVQAALDARLPDAVAGTTFHLGSVPGGGTLLPAFNNVNIINALVTATLTANFTIDAADLPSAPKANTQFAMRLTQDATGGRTLTMTGFKKSFGSLSLSSGPGDIDVLVFFYDGTSWFAGAMGLDFS